MARPITTYHPTARSAAARYAGTTARAVAIGATVGATITIIALTLLNLASGCGQPGGACILI